MGDSAVGIGVVVLDNEYEKKGMRQSEGHNKVDDSREAPSVYHLGVGIHVDPIVHGSCFESEREGEVLGEAAFEEPGSIFPQKELFYHASGLDHSAGEQGYNLGGDGQGESMEHVFCQ